MNPNPNPSAANDTLDARLAGVRLVALDVDGVLTDGRIAYVEERELMRFDASDGLGLRWLQESGVQVALISGRGCRATKKRALELGIREIHLRVGDKCRLLQEVQKRLGLEREHTAAMGDDLPDLALARAAHVFVTPANGRPEVKQRADWVTTAHGGRGAVRELCERILRASGGWDATLARYEIPSR